MTPLAPQPRGRRGRTAELLTMAAPVGATLTQIPQAARRIGGGKVIAVRGPVDVMGTLDGGQAIVADVKQCDRVNSFSCHDDFLPEHQRLELARHGAAGALAGLLILSTERGWWYWASWRRLHPRPKSLRWDDLPQVGPQSRAVDWWTVKAMDRADNPAEPAGAPSAGGAE
jgi:hypothetical protein